MPGSKILNKLNNQMRKAGHHILYVCDNASSHKDLYSNIKFLHLPPNSMSILQPLDQGIILSVKRNYKKKLAEKYLGFVENHKDAVDNLKKLDVVAATKMIAQAWRETSSTIIKNCFRKAHFIHPEIDPDPEPEEPPIQPNPAVWHKVEDWLQMNFEEFVAHEPPATTTEPMTDEQIVDLIRTENDAPEQDSEDEEDDISHTNMIKTTTEFLAIIEQQRAFLSRNKLPTEPVKHLESLILENQLSLCCKQKEVTDYFPSSQSPKSKSQHSFCSTAEVSNLMLVDSLDDAAGSFDIEGIDLDKILVDTSLASVAASVLLRNEVLPPDLTSTPKPKWKRPNTPGQDSIESLMVSQDKINLSHSKIKQHLLVRVHSVNSDVIPGLTSAPDITQTTPEPQVTQTNAPMPINNSITQEQQWAPTLLPNTGTHSISEVQEAQVIRPTKTKKLTG